MQLLAVAVGGALGAVLRWVLSGWVMKLVPSFAPAGTLAANVAGCLLIGFLAAALPRGGTGETWRLLLITGLLGSLTTFSTFGFQTVELLRESELRPALANVMLNLAVGLPAVWLGMWLGSGIGNAE